MIHVIYGPPCGGKSTYVRENAKAGDLVIDNDLIAQTLGAQVRHGSEGHVFEAALAARKAAIDVAISDPQSESWVIDGSLARLKEYEEAGAEIVGCDPGLEECLARCAKDERPDGTERRIRKWYEREKKGVSMTETKSFKLAPLSDEGGSIKGYAATFDRIPDSYGDIIAPGAFADTLKAWASKGNPVPLLWGHVTDNPNLNIGAVYEMHEDERGLYFEANLDSENPNAQYVRKLVSEGRVYQFSFAYAVRDSANVKLDDGTTVRELRKLDLYEISVVQIPANQNATVEDIKSEEVEEKAGRILSKSNEDKINEAISILESVVAQLRDDDESEAEAEEMKCDCEVSTDAQTVEAKGEDASNPDQTLLDYYKLTTFKDWN